MPPKESLETRIVRVETKMDMLTKLVISMWIPLLVNMLLLLLQ